MRAYCAISDGGADSPKRAPVAAPELETKSKATSVEALRKYREAKVVAATTEGAPVGAAGRAGEKPAPPPKVDLYK